LTAVEHAANEVFSQMVGTELTCQSSSVDDPDSEEHDRQAITAVIELKGSIYDSSMVVIDSLVASQVGAVLLARDDELSAEEKQDVAGELANMIVGRGKTVAELSKMQLGTPIIQDDVENVAGQRIDRVVMTCEWGNVEIRSTLPPG
jgi:CheY-specific phosphatase CheX